MAKIKVLKILTINNFEILNIQQYIQKFEFIKIFAKKIKSKILQKFQIKNFAKIQKPEISTNFTKLIF